MFGPGADTRLSVSNPRQSPLKVPCAFSKIDLVPANMGAEEEEKIDEFCNKRIFKIE